MYVAVKGGEKAIDNAHRLLARKRRGDTAPPELSVEQIRQQMPLAVSRVMTEGSLYDEQLAALAIKQAAGDLMEAIFLLPRLPHHAAALRRQPAAGHRRDASATTYLGDLQGPAGRATARSDLRLYPSPARLQPARRGRLPWP